MAAAAHDPGFAKRIGIPSTVAKEFNQADKGTALLKQSMTAKALREEGPRHERSESRSFERAEKRRERY